MENVENGKTKLTRESIEQWIERDLESAFILLHEIMKSRIIKDAIVKVMWETYKLEQEKQSIQEALKEQQNVHE